MKLNVAIAFAALAGTVVAGEQLLNLPPAPKGGRFAVPSDRVWPEKPGTGDVCLWKGDRFAACAITIDDNCKPDHDWWLKLTDELGIKVTWFVVTDGPEKKKNPGFNGTWADFQRLADAGHSIQSHTTNHRSVKKGEAQIPESDLVEMYGHSLETINAHVTNNLATCIAYPRGEAHVEVAARYAIACRGVYGVPSEANSINYMNTNKGSGGKGHVQIVAFGETSEGPKWIQGKKALKRGLNTVLYHFCHAGRTPEEKEKNAAAAEAEVRYIASLKDDRLWVCRFDDVMKYAQERDTAKLSCRLDGDKIRVAVTDDMKDGLFDFPLTVKVRLPDGWKSVTGGTFVEHGGKPYALVDVVPDKGEVTLAQGGRK
jgi:hypothetical protein